MAIEIQQSEAKKAEFTAPAWTHAAPDPIRGNVAAPTNVLVEDLKRRLGELLASYENRVITPDLAEGLKLQIHDISNLFTSVSVSVGQDSAQVTVVLSLRGEEQELKSEFAARSLNDEVVDVSKDTDSDGGAPKKARMRGGKSTTGIFGSAPYAEPPEPTSEDQA